MSREFRRWRRSLVYPQLGWFDEGPAADGQPGYEEREWEEFVTLPDGTVPMASNAAACRIAQVSVPEGGFLAVIVRGPLNADAAKRLQGAFADGLKEQGVKFPVFVLNGDMELVGVGPDRKVA